MKLTDPEQASELVSRTEIDALAVAIGTVHRLYKVKPQLDISRLKAIRQEVTVPLVLHGGSDTPDEAIKEAIEAGITKINIANELKLAYARPTVRLFLENPEKYDPRKFFWSEEKVSKI